METTKYKKGHRFEYGGLEYEKMGDRECDWWLCLNSTYVRVSKNEQGEDVHELRPESEKPLYNRDGRLNRWAFKMTDDQVTANYKLG